MKEEKPVYEDITDFKKLKSFMENNLEDYNNEPGYIAMDLVLFRDAIEHGIYDIKSIYLFTVPILHLLFSYSYRPCYSTTKGQYVTCWYWWQWEAELVKTGCLHYWLSSVPD